MDSDRDNPNVVTGSCAQCWILLRWTDQGGISVLGVYSHYDDALLAKGDTCDPRRQIVQSEYHAALVTVTA